MTTRGVKTSLAVCFLAVLSVQSTRAEPNAKLAAPATAQEIEQLVSDLGAASYGTRTHATRRLWAIGMPARDRLVEAARAESPEVALRAKRLLKVFDTFLFHGVEVELKFSKTRVAWNEPVDLHVTLVNRSGFPARVPIETDTGRRSELSGDPRQVADMLDVGEWLQVLGPSGRPVGLRVDDINLDHSIAEVVRLRVTDGPFSELAPNERATITVRRFNRGWARMPLLDAGRYVVQFDYTPTWEDEVLSDAQVGRVVSRQATITVTESAPDTVSRRGPEAGVTIERNGNDLVAMMTNRTDQPMHINLNFGTAPPFAVGRWVYDHAGNMKEASSVERAGVSWRDFRPESLAEIAPGASVELTRIPVKKLFQRLAENGAAMEGRSWELYFTYSNLCDRNWQRREQDMLDAHASAPDCLKKPLPRRILTGWHTSNRIPIADSR